MTSTETYPHNLAPICAKCNRDKSNTNVAGLGVVSTHLLKAAPLEPRIIREVRSLVAAPATAKVLLKLAQADLKDEPSRALIEQLGDSVMRTLTLGGR